MHKKTASLKKVLVIGSGPIVIGQAAEFDYSGTQCLNVLKSLGIESVLLNSNPATIMTDEKIADTIYMEPLTKSFLKKVILKENPDGILGTFGGQVGLNLVKELAEEEFLAKENVIMLGTSLQSIKWAEDRLLFRNKMVEIGEPVPPGQIVSSIEEGLTAAKEIGFPLVIRPAYTLGGSGGGIVYNDQELVQTLSLGIKRSAIGQCLLETSILGYKEIEYEVMRDAHGQTIIVCNMENFDPVGVHTGDSIVVAPSQTISDQEYQMLRNASINIVDKLNIVGACNVQLALHPTNGSYYVIEVNPRVSRSSALASKATGYPIAKLAAYLALGWRLDEIPNPIVKGTYASFEPTLDYLVVKIPRWPFDKFHQADRKLNTQMKSTGEVMALGRTFEQGLLKAIRSLELDEFDLRSNDCQDLTKEDLLEVISTPNDRRLWQIAQFFRLGGQIAEVQKATQISAYFLDKIAALIEVEKKIATVTDWDQVFLKKIKTLGFSDQTISEVNGIEIERIKELKSKYSIRPTVKTVDSCGAEFEAITPYYYLTYEDECEFESNTDQKNIVVIGSGPIRIGQGIEFDYSCVHAIQTCEQLGYETVMINNNPETCSTDYSISDRLYFEPLFLEDVLAILEMEQPEGVIVQFGGQTALNLSKEIERSGFCLLGTSSEIIDLAEDRERFTAFLDKLEIQQPKGFTLTDLKDQLEVLKSFNYPVMTRPSFVLGGKSMAIHYNFEEAYEFLTSDTHISASNPVLVDEYIKGKEIEVDAITDGETVYIPGIMEHVERAGVHSGDSIAVYPPQNLFEDVIQSITESTIKICKNMGVQGVVNIQYMYKKGTLYVIEVNPRGSRTIPFLSKMTKVPMVELATRVMLGERLQGLGYKSEVGPTPDFCSVKVPVFSFEKLADVEPALGPEMKSTGEVLGRAENFPLALYKGLIAQGLHIPFEGSLLVTVSDRYKDEILPIVKGFNRLGFKIYATSGTAKFITDHCDMKVFTVSKKKDDGRYHLFDMIRNNEVDLIINTLSKGRRSNRDGFLMRRLASEKQIPCFTSLDTVHGILEILNLSGLKLYEQ
jgi:carbamoyl-phosphate synthase large subunit